MNLDTLPVAPIATNSDQVEAVTAALAAHSLALVPRFPAETDRFLDFLSNFGEPLHYYGDGTGTHPSSGAIWRIKYDPAQAARREIHAVDGPLMPHSSQSLRDPRPPYFCMFMIDHGWLDMPTGKSGASLLVRWSDVLERMHTVDPGGYAEIVAALEASVPHPGGIARPVVYRLTSPRGPYDLGVRLKSDLLEHLRSQLPEHPSTRAVELLSTTALEVAQRIQLRSGDLLLLDNDRWGHGRESVVGRRRRAGREPELNPRELWSVTLG
ncbi:TauD/TfdA family dioxygenase [Rhodococcus wratislaviensis]|nr:TauD/TfdA family dioxygenase [Rhodococcus wratislaviensis]